VGQSIGSVGNSHKRRSADAQSKNQPEMRPGQKMADQRGPNALSKLDRSPGHGPRFTC
jgi:hypothetical protein